MPSAFTHAFAGASVGIAFRAPRMVCVLVALLAVFPDVDIIGFSLGVQYGDRLGHRGFTHSLLFAAIMATLAGLASVALGPRIQAPAPAGSCSPSPRRFLRGSSAFSASCS